MNILIPFPTENTRKVIQQLARITRDAFTCITDIPEAFDGHRPAFIATANDIGLVDLDSQRVSILRPNEDILPTIQRTLEKLNELMEEYDDRYWVHDPFQFIYFSENAADRRPEPVEEDVSAALREAFYAIEKKLQVKSLFDKNHWEINKLAMDIALRAGFNVIDNQEEPLMTTYKLSAKARALLDDIPSTIELVYFKALDLNQVKIYGLNTTTSRYTAEQSSLLIWFDEVFKDLPHPPFSVYFLDGFKLKPVAGKSWADLFDESFNNHLAGRSPTEKAAEASVPIQINPKETPTMNSVKLSPSTKRNMNNLLVATSGFYFSIVNDTVTVYVYTYPPTGTRQRLDLLEIPTVNFFDPSVNAALGGYEILRSFVLHCPDSEVKPGDAFETAFAEFFKKHISIPVPQETPVRKNISRWNSDMAKSSSPPRDRVTFPDAPQHDQPAAFDRSGGFQPHYAYRPDHKWDSVLTAEFAQTAVGVPPENITQIKVKYNAILNHIAVVRRWLILMTYLSKEIQSVKEDNQAILSAPPEFDTIQVVLRFAVEDLLSAQFLAAQKDGLVLGVRTTLDSQTELNFIDVRFWFDLKAM